MTIIETALKISNFRYSSVWKLISRLKNPMNYSRNFRVMESYFYVSGGLVKIFSAVRGLEVPSKPIFFEATSGHPKFYVEKHGWPIFKTPASVLIYAKLRLCKQ